jgi:superfamily II DNA/RNA helicase
MPYSYRSSRSSSLASKYSRSRTGQRKNNRGRQGEYIDPSRFIKAAKPAESEVYEPTHLFTDFALDPRLQNNVAAKGYTVPSPIQDQAMPVALNGHDVIGIAGTGTGKTAAFALPVLQRLISDGSAAAIIIAPTRELAQQIEQECRALARGYKWGGALLIGGTGMGQQLRDLRYNPRIVIGTPGRIKDHLQRGTLKLQRFNIVVLDEVDRMLDMGFVHDVTQILSQTNQTRQSLFFSATMDTRVRSLIESFTQNPTTIALKPSSASDSVHQDVVRYQSGSDKVEKLHDLLVQDKVAKVIIFDETQRSVERLNRELVERGFSADAIHGGKTQGQRQRALLKFKNSEVSILVATDVAARGIDVADVTHVINFSVPKAYDDYIHRIGRAGRAGQIGYALTFVAH